MKIRPAGAELFHGDRKTDGRTDTMKLVVAFQILGTRLKTKTNGCIKRVYTLDTNIVRKISRLCISRIKANKMFNLSHNYTWTLNCCSFIVPYLVRHAEAEINTHKHNFKNLHTGTEEDHDKYSYLVAMLCRYLQMYRRDVW